MTTTGSLLTQEPFLTPEERYEIWIVKAAERPELLEVHHDEEGEASPPQEEMALSDGCDIPGWRSRGLATATNWTTRDSNTIMRTIGSGSSLLRRENCLPVAPCSNSGYTSHWKDLQRRLLQADSIPHSHLADRIHYKDAQEHPLIQERENRPVIVDGCTEKWAAMDTCRFDRLVERFGDMEWRFSDTHAEGMTLRTYQKYVTSLEGTSDDSPLAVYDSQFGTDERSVILNEYDVPACFDADLFPLMDDIEDTDNETEGSDCFSGDEELSHGYDGMEEDDPAQRRPPFRWILIGPERSGTGLHVDPVGTHAWVTLVEGCKRWVLFPPETPRDEIFMQFPQIPSAVWFNTHYHDAIAQNVVIEVLQKPGETVYVPAGWPHLVLNLELSVAITHNYASEFPSIDRLIKSVQDEEPKLLPKFCQAMVAHKPELMTGLKVSSKAERTTSSGAVACPENDECAQCSKEKSQ